MHSICGIFVTDTSDFYEPYHNTCLMKKNLNVILISILLVTTGHNPVSWSNPEGDYFVRFRTKDFVTLRKVVRIDY